MQTTKLNVGELVMGIKYSGFTTIVLYSNIYPKKLVYIYRPIEQSCGLPIGPLRN